MWFCREIALELRSGMRPSKQSDVYSLAFVVSYIQQEMRLDVTEEVVLGLSDNPTLRPTAHDIMRSLIAKRSCGNGT